MKKLIFVTGNAGKLSEAQALMPGAEVRGVPMDFDEPRSNDLTYIARKKAEQAKKWIESPFFVQDAGFYVPTLNGFPGSYVNFALKTIGVEGILKLMEGKEDRSCAFRQCLVYWDGQKKASLPAKIRGGSLKHTPGAIARSNGADFGIFLSPKAAIGRFRNTRTKCCGSGEKTAAARFCSWHVS